MYLWAEKYFTFNYQHPELNIKEDDYLLKAHRYEAGYWRKHPDLHGYIVQHFSYDGDDNCQPIELSVKDMRQIIQAIETDELPHTEGFFFGESENDQEQKNDAIEIFTKAIAWLEDNKNHPNEWRSIEYQASW